MTIVIASHFVRSGEHIYSPLVDNLEIILKNKNLNYLVIQHTLNNDFKSRYFLSNKKQINIMKYVFHNISVIRYITEIFATIFLLLSLWYKKESVLFIWIDPLNTIAGLLFKLYNKKSKVIYYIPDYSPKRFNNRLLNSIYHFLEKTATNKSDQVFCVSEEIYKIKNYRNNVHIFKNYPPISLINSISWINIQKNRKDLFIIWLLEDYYLMDEILNALKVIILIDTNIKLHIIWWWTKLQDFKNKVSEYNLINNVIFTWYLDKGSALKYINNLGISLTIYSNSQSYDKYRDSVKIRESIALWLPIITTNNHSTSIDLIKNNLWIVIDSNNKNISEKIIEAYNAINKNYDFYKENCLKFYNEDYKNEIIFNNILKHEIK